MQSIDLFSRFQRAAQDSRAAVQSDGKTGVYQLIHLQDTDVDTQHRSILFDDMNVSDFVDQPEGGSEDDGSPPTDNADEPVAKMPCLSQPKSSTLEHRTSNYGDFDDDQEIVDLT